MAWMESKLQPIDLLSALQMKYQQDAMSKSGEDRRDGGMGGIDQLLAQQLAQNDIPVTPENMRKFGTGFGNFGMATVTGEPQNELTGEYAMRMGQTRFLKDMPGYVTGTPPEQYSAERNAIRVALAGAGGGGGYGGGQSPEEANLLTAQTDIANENAQKMRLENQGYGSAGRDLVAQQQMEADITNKQATNKRMLDITQMEAQGKIDAALAAARGKVDAATVVTSGNAPKEDSRAMQSERDDLYKFGASYGLSADQLSALESNLPKFYKAYKGAPIPWSKIVADVKSGILIL